MGIMVFGILLVYDVSMSESLEAFGTPWHFVLKQLLWAALGLGAFLVVSRVPLDWWKRAAPLIFGGAVLLLIAVLIPGIGTKVQGARRWIFLGPLSIQPAELTKLAIILFFSTWLERHQRFPPFLALTGLIAGLIILQPNLSMAAITIVLATTLFFLAGGNLKPLFLFGTLGILLLSILIIAVPYRRQRLLTFLNPASDPLGRSYHIRQITIALGRGGWIGQGIGLSQQKYQYIPEASSDSIFAIWAEETGLVGSLTLIGVFTVLFGTCWYITTQQTELFPFLVGAGITVWITLHTLLNLAAMVALIPLTGVPLPLISAGGSSLLSFMVALGIMNQLGRHTVQSR
jgi:cell division protein FtsW